MGQKGKLYLWPRNLAMHVIMEIIALILLMPASLHIRRMGGCVCTLPCGSIIWSAFHITLFCPLILVLLVLCRSPLQSFPLSSARVALSIIWVNAHSSSLQPLSLPSFILISLFRQIGSAKWGNYENCALMNCKISSLARPPASHLNLSKGEGGRRCIEVDQRMVLRVRDSPSPDSPWQQVAFMQPRNHCLAEQCTSTQHIFLQVRNQSFTWLRDTRWLRDMTNKIEYSTIFFQRRVKVFT